MTPIRFDVVGLPKPQGNHTAVIAGGKARLIEGRRGTSREQFRDWRSAVAAAARDAAGAEPLDGPLALAVRFRMPRPKSWPKRIPDPCWHTSAPDASKLLRALEDSLIAGGLIADDSRIALSTVHKIATARWTGAEIIVGHPSEHVALDWLPMGGAT
jgi:Holliday junction resolvase RusA-like endonuclease